MLLYLGEELFKSSSFRGGKYYTRVQDGWKANGDPKYHYFYSPEDYQKFKDQSGNSSDGANKELQRKVSSEHEEGKRFAQQHVKEKVPKEEDVDPEDEETDLRSKQQMLYVKG